MIFDGESGGLIAAVLRPGRRPFGDENAMIMRRVLKLIRRHFPDAHILVRGDGGIVVSWDSYLAVLLLDFRVEGQSYDAFLTYPCSYRNSRVSTVKFFINDVMGQNGVTIKAHLRYRHLWTYSAPS